MLSPAPTEPANISYILNLPAELKLQIFLTSLDRLSIEALAQTCKAFYQVFFRYEPLIWRAKRQVGQAQRDELPAAQRFK